ncbi:MAG: GspE/PulE family protein [Verrucomicrobiales bacterium]
MPEEKSAPDSPTPPPGKLQSSLPHFFAQESEGELLCHRLLEDALEARATDIHIDPTMTGYLIRFRIDGVLAEVARIERGYGERLVNQFKTESGIDPGAVITPRAARHTHRLHGRELDTRVTLAPCISGQKLAIRMLDPEQVRHRLGDLGLSDDGHAKIGRWLASLNGMFLVTGPTGSGKTTTLYALLHELASRDRHILTIEDPVEYEVDGINQIQVDARHGLDFAEGLKAMLRLDPDYLMVGEMRDAESAAVAARAAISGHVVLSTIHARDSVSAATALVNLGLSPHQIAVSLAAVVNQRLIRLLCPHCKRRTSPTAQDKEWLDAAGLEMTGEAWGPLGCEKCKGLGYHGRTGLFEIWHLEESDYALILGDADERTLRGHLAKAGHRRLVDEGMAAVKRGITSLAEVRRVVALQGA